MTWNPPANVVAAGIAAQNRIAYVGASQILARESIQLPIWPGASVLAAWIVQHFAGVYSVGLRRGSAIQRPAMNADGSLRRRDVHEEGRALDAMIHSLAAGEAVANWLVLHAQTLGIQLVIWDHVEWSSSSRGAAWQNYTGVSPHTDHVHAEVTPAFAESAEKMQLALAQIDASSAPPSSDWSGLGLLALAMGAGVAFVYRNEIRDMWRSQRQRSTERRLAY